MRLSLLSLLSPLLLLSSDVLAAKGPPSASALASKLDKLAAKGNGVVKLDSNLYDEITKGPRDFSVSIVLTALATSFKCGPCRTFDAEHKLLARSWSRSPKRKEHFLTVLDFAEGSDVFRRLGLNTAPALQFFHATDGPNASTLTGPEGYDFNRHGFSADSFANFLSSKGVPIRFSRPPDYTKLATVALAVVLGLVVTRVAWDYVKVVLLSRWIWAIGTILTILTMTSGHMWNTIRNPPYYVPGEGGSINFIAAGYSNQFGMETQVVAVIYGILAFAFYTLAVTIPKLSADPIRQRFGIYVWSGVLVVMFGILTSLFRMKNPGYPFRILF